MTYQTAQHMMKARDNHLSSPVQVYRYNAAHPCKGLVKQCMRVARWLVARGTPRLSLAWRLRALTRQRAIARPMTVSDSAAFPGGHTYFEIQIGNQTRTVAFMDPSRRFFFEHVVQPNDEFLFGLAPQVEEEERPPTTWQGVLTVQDMEGKCPVRTYTIQLPYNRRTECFAYFAGDGWVDCRLPLAEWTGQRIRCELVPSVAGSVSCPQVLPRKPVTDVRKVILLSVESLTDLLYLRRRYGRSCWPNVDALCAEAVSYPRVYAPADSTLSFAASMQSGLLPSQHGVGNYAVMPYHFHNDTVNRQLTTLSRLFKQQRFFTTFGATETRFSSKSGWARGFDHFTHVFDKWEATVPQVDWLIRTLRAGEGFDQFVHLHIDFLHEPLVAFNPVDGVRCHDVRLLQTTQGDNTEALYFAQLEELDFHLGRLFSHLKDQKLFDRTAIMLTGDHGCGIHWVKHRDFSLYEERIRVPLIVKYPEWAAQRLATQPIVNSTVEIRRIAHALFGEALPAYLIALPQYNSTAGQYAFAETVMNPRHDYKAHCLAVMNHPYKYVCWNRIDWDARRVEAFGREQLFLWDESAQCYDESHDVGGRNGNELETYRDLARKIIARNLDFLAQYPPCRY